MFNKQIIGQFILHVCSEVYDDACTTEYRECFLLEQGKHYIYYVNLHKDERIQIMDFKSFSGIGELTEAQATQRKKKYCADKNISEEAYAVRYTEYRAYESRKDYSQPPWKLHISTVDAVIKRLQEIANVQTN